jgi:phospholipase/carboxylesterase
MALELVQAHDGMAGRVLAFSGRYAQLPKAAPTTPS